MELTEAAAADVINDLCAFIKENKHIVNSGQTKLLQTHGNDGLIQRYLKGIPTPLKVIAGEEGGIDYYKVAALENDPACWPDKKHVGSYFLGGTPIRPPVKALLDLPAYGGETAETGGMKVRTGNHRRPYYR
ncbi:hypothetical protein KCU77_g7960, partial [Aureobasidium melanogenum]